MIDKTILCFGDSNTWGYVAEGHDGSYLMRYPPDVRWPGALRRELEEPGWHVIEAGLCGRTTAFDDPMCEGRNGLTDLKTVLLEMPVPDAVIIALGINDLKEVVCGSTDKSASAFSDILRYLKTCQSDPPAVLAILPARIGPGIFSPPFGAEFGRPTIIEESVQLNEKYAAAATALEVPFVDAAQYAAAGPDGLHLTAESHIRLASAVADALRSLFAQNQPKV